MHLIKECLSRHNQECLYQDLNILYHRNLWRSTERHPAFLVYRVLSKVFIVFYRKYKLPYSHRRWFHPAFPRWSLYLPFFFFHALFHFSCFWKGRMVHEVADFQNTEGALQSKNQNWVETSACVKSLWEINLSVESLIFVYLAMFSRPNSGSRPKNVFTNSRATGRGFQPPSFIKIFTWLITAKMIHTRRE